VKGSKKARREGAAALGLTYRIEIPRFSQGMLNAKAEALDEISAMQKSAVPSITSPSIPFQLPGEVSPPYWRR
jgi:hypothetical protein